MSGIAVAKIGASLIGNTLNNTTSLVASKAPSFAVIVKLPVP